MSRRLFTLLSAASLALCVATCVLWVRSYWALDVVADVAVLRLGTWDLRSVGGWLVAAEPRERFERAAHLAKLSRWAAEAARLMAGADVLAAKAEKLAAEADALAAAERGAGRAAYAQPAATAPAGASGGTAVRSAAGHVRLLRLQADEEARAMRGEAAYWARLDRSSGPPLTPYARHPVRHAWVAAAAAVLGLAMASMSRLAGRIRGRRLRAVGLCPACGYDLRASPGRCPECGAGRV